MNGRTISLRSAVVAPAAAALLLGGGFGAEAQPAPRQQAANQVSAPAAGALLQPPALSQGLRRTGAVALEQTADGGSGLVIAVLDMGFGGNLERLQALDELPPSDRLETLSFDAAGGLAGSNAYGNPTNHGELVAQTVYDYAPRARYLYVNYHTEDEFIAATDWLATRRPDIVVHSNNFLEGPFDGSGALAQAVDRAAGAGILWFNSAGNYALQHWAGPWRDADRDGTLDFADPDWSFARNVGQRITFALSWNNADPAHPTDLDLIVEYQGADGAWEAVAASEDRQAAGARPAERVTGWRASADGRYRVRVVHRSGPLPSGDLTLFSREIPLAGIGGSPAVSVPTPADARGAIAVGAVDWRGDRLRGYSSHGPTPDGRLKPDLVAPTDTWLMGPLGRRGVGGTSNAAPNAAGAAALMLAAARAAGRPSDARTIRARLAALAYDLGPPGPDPAYGAGRVRATLTGPAVVDPRPTPGAWVRGVVMARVALRSPNQVTDWSLEVDGQTVMARPGARPGGLRIDTRRLGDGIHRLRLATRDMAGNVGARRWAVRVDNRPPRIVRARLRRVSPGPGRPLARPAGTPVELVLRANDGENRTPLSVSIAVAGSDAPPRAVSLRPGLTRTVPLGALAPGLHAARVSVADRAGNRTVVRLRVRIAGRGHPSPPATNRP